MAFDVTAQTITWTNSIGRLRGLWSNSQNWSNHAEPTLSNSVMFPVGFPDGNTTITLSSGETASAMDIEDNYAFEGMSATTGDLTLGKGLINVNADAAIIAVPIGGSSGLTKTGTGMLSLTSANPFTGNIAIQAGTLSVDMDSELGDAANGVTLSGGAALAVTSDLSTSRSFTIDSTGGGIAAAATCTINSALAGTSGTFTSSGGGTLILTASSARTGANTIALGTTRLEDALALGSGTVTVRSTAALELHNIQMTQAATLNGGILRGIGSATYSGVITAASTNSAIQLGTGTSSTDLLTIGASDGAYTGGSSNLTLINGAGTVFLPFANAGYAGSWEIDSGTLHIANNQSLGTSTAPIVLAGGALTIDNATLSNDVTIANNTTLSGIGSASFAGNGTIAANATVTFDTGTSSTNVFTVGSSGKTFRGGSGATIHMTGSGELLLSQPTTYAGAWSLDAGTLRITQPNALSNANVTNTINNGATLQLDTALGGHLNINDGAAISTSIADGFFEGTGTIASAANVTLRAPTGASLEFGETISSQFTGLTGGANATIHAVGGGSIMLDSNANYLGAWSLEGPYVSLKQANGFGSAASVSVSGPSVLDIGVWSIQNNLQAKDGAKIQSESSDQGTPPSLNGILDIADGATVNLRAIGISSFEPGLLVVGSAPNDVTGGQGSTIQLYAYNAPVEKGVITLPFANDYAGSWQITQGVLQIDNSNSLGTGTTAVQIGPATLRLEHVAVNRDVTLTASSSIDMDGTDSSLGNITGAGSLTINSAGTLSVNSIRTAGLTLNAGTMRIKPNGGAAGVSTVPLLLIASNTQLDLTNNALLVDYTPGNSPFSTIASQIKSAYANGSWNGQGITSSMASASAPHATALGYAEASSLGMNSMLGQPVDSTTVLIRYTYCGDANLDGTVNALDFNALATNYGRNNGKQVWAQGDFNYDGTVNSSDFDSLATNYGEAMPTSAAIVDASPAGVLVPEPAALSILISTTLRLRQRRIKTFMD